MEGAAAATADDPDVEKTEPLDAAAASVCGGAKSCAAGLLAGDGNELAPRPVATVVGLDGGGGTAVTCTAAVVTGSKDTSKVGYCPPPVVELDGTGASTTSAEPGAPVARALRSNETVVWSALRTPAAEGGVPVP
jgi:hypothetical protein